MIAATILAIFLLMGGSSMFGDIMSNYIEDPIEAIIAEEDRRELALDAHDDLEDAIKNFNKQVSEDMEKLNELVENYESTPQEFDQLFSTRTGYDSLDDRIAKSQEKKEPLLAVLRHPELPLHNNAAELAARVQARARDVSLHTKSKAGTKAKDTFMSIVQTAKKLGVNTYQYLYDRVSGKFELPSLAQLIREKSKAEPPACPNPP